MRFHSVLVRVFPLALCWGEALAATEFTTTVPEDLLREFTGGTAFSDLPEGFPPFVMPEGLLPIGSQQAPNQQMVLLRTSRGGAESQRAVADALRASGSWVDIAPPGSARSNGFVIPARGIEPVTVCHDEHGIVEILGEDGIENRVYIRRYALANAPRRPTCAQQNQGRIAGRPPVGLDPSALGRYMPSFETLIPPVEPSAAADPSTRRDDLTPPLNVPQLGIRGVPSGMINTGSPNRSFVGRFAPTPANLVSIRNTSSAGLQASVPIPVADRSLRTFRRLISGSMKAQGWKLDSEWNRTDAAASHWLQENDGGKRMLLRLHIARIPEGFYIVDYELSELDN